MDIFFSIDAMRSNSIRVSFSTDERHWIEGNACGLGMQDILIILCIIIDTKFNFIMIEEPESHIHPYMQRKLIQFIRERTDKQFLLSTHSNVFLDPEFVDKIIYAEMKERVILTNQTSKASILMNLGYSVTDNLVSDLLILTEGPYDVLTLKALFEKFDFWQKYKISFLFLGGDAMKHIDLSPLAEHNKVIALIDNDPGSKHIRDIFKKKCEDIGIKCYQLKNYAIENYFTIPAIKKIFPGKITEEITSLAHDKKVEDQLGFSVKALGKEIVRNMDLKEFDNTDLKYFCDDIKNLLEKTN